MGRNNRIRNYGLAGLTLVSTFVVAIFVGCRTDFGGLGATGDFLATGRTLSSFTAIQVDPRSEDSAGPQFVVAEDINGDGFVDLVSAWNQSQPVQIHFQRRTSLGAIRFETVTLAGNVPVVSVAGLGVTDFDLDGRMDIAVLAKETLEAGSACLDSELPQTDGLSGVVLLYLGPDDAALTDEPLAWTEIPVEDSRLEGKFGATGSAPEDGGFTAMRTGDIDGDGDMDILVAWNSDCGGETPVSDVVLFSNNGAAAVRDGSWTGSRIPNTAPIGTTIKDVAVGDIDEDGDLDIVATFPDAGSLNIRWFRNPQIDIQDDYHISDGQWQTGTVGQIATGADVIRIGDIDRDEHLDVVVRSSAGKLIQWLKGPGVQSTTQPLPNLPWQVYTLAEFTQRTPSALALADLNFDGQLEVLASADGAVEWFNSQQAPTVYDQWIENIIIDDEPEASSGNTPPTTDPNVTPTEVAGGTRINTILPVDLDGDGAIDLIATLDRSGLSGISNDALVWFRNTRVAP